MPAGSAYLQKQLNLFDIILIFVTEVLSQQGCQAHRGLHNHRKDVLRTAAEFEVLCAGK